jgi:hypothetical protein
VVRCMSYRYSLWYVRTSHRSYGGLHPNLYPKLNAPVAAVLLLIPLVTRICAACFLCLLIRRADFSTSQSLLLSCTSSLVPPLLCLLSCASFRTALRH